MCSSDLANQGWNVWEAYLVTAAVASRLILRVALTAMEPCQENSEMVGFGASGCRLSAEDGGDADMLVIEGCRADAVAPGEGNGSCEGAWAS